MKKTFNINLNGQVFCMDDDACLKLQSYIDTLEKYYLKEEDGREIMSDIESRIAELLQEALNKGYKQVVTLQEIEKVIQIMGTPEVIIEEDSEHTSHPIKHKLYRDVDASVLGGVASGLAAYFDISVVAIRITFVLLGFFYGITILVYLILWIATPAAVTAKQKLEMKGEKINVSNIEKNIRDTYNDLKKNSSFQQFFEQLGNGLKKIFQKLSTIFCKILKIIFSFLAVLGLLGGLFLFILIFWGLLYPEHITNFTLYHILYSIFPPALLTTYKVLLFLTLNIPLLLLIYLSARYLFHFSWNKTFVVASIGLWFLAGVCSIVLTIQQGLYYSETTENSTNQLLTPADSSSHKYVLNFQDLSDIQKNIIVFPSDKTYFNILAFDQIPPKQMYLKAYINVIQNLYTQPSITIQKQIQGSYSPDNLSHLNNIQYQWKQNGNELFLDNYFKIQQQGWKGQTVNVTLSIPEGDTLVIHGNNRKKNYMIHMEIPFQEAREEYITVMKNGQLQVINEEIKIKK